MKENKATPESLQAMLSARDLKDAEFIVALCKEYIGKDIMPKRAGA